MAIPAGAISAARRYGPSVDKIAAQYRNPLTGKPLTGAALLLKLSSGENAFRMGGSPSSAGARGATQFTPGSRQVAINKFGIDPWADYNQAFHAAALHLLGKINGSTGLRGYNPGMPSYTNYILGQRIGKVSGLSGGAPPRVTGGTSSPPSTASPNVQPAEPLQSGGTGLADILASLQQQQPRAMSAGVPSPDFSSDRYLTGGGSVPVGGMAPQPKLNIGSLIAAIQPGQGVADVPQPQIQGSGAGTGSSPGTARPAVQAVASGGKVIVAPGANRAGVGLSKGILKLVRQLSAQAGHPITIGTGTNHNQYVAGSSNVSDHWGGNAADIPAAGAALTKLGQQALIAFGMSPAQARKATGGVYNLQYGKHRRIQVLFNTNVGGNHYNHLHVGVTAL